MTYIDLEILAYLDEDELLLRIEKSEFSKLLSNLPDLNVRHWDGKKPTRIRPYGDNAVRTEGDSTEDNNLTELPRVSGRTLGELIDS